MSSWSIIARTWRYSGSGAVMTSALVAGSAWMKPPVAAVVGEVGRVGVVGAVHDGHRHRAVVDQRRRHRADQRAGQPAVALGTDDDRVAAQPLGDVDEPGRGLAGADLDLVLDAGGVEQRGRRRDQVLGGAAADFVDDLGVVRGDDLVERGRGLHVGEHEARAQPRAHQAQRMVHRVQRGGRAVDRQQDLERHRQWRALAGRG